MTYDEAVAWIHDRIKFGIRPGLIRINALLETLGNPQDKLKIVHIGGTNGKGSTTTFLRCLLEEQGLKVGTFTSPYIERFNERIAINGQAIPDDDLVELLSVIKPLVEEMDQQPELENAVEFEVLTAMMFQYFLEQEVDIVLVEVGLGGRYDCTNVMTPLISVITTIGLDHVDILGDTIEEIASQKAGIIKENTPVVVGRVDDKAFEVIKDEANALNSTIYRYGQEFTSQAEMSHSPWEETFSFEAKDERLQHLVIPMLGKHQIDNASVALQTFLLLKEMLHLPVAHRDFQKALSQAFWPGRLEKISEEPLILLDGAHNEHAMTVLVDKLTTDFKHGKIYTIFGALSTKDIDGMIGMLQSVKNVELKVTEFDYPKAVTKETYESMALSAYDEWQVALVDVMRDVTSDDMILITGSLYFISQVRETLIGGHVSE